MNEIILHSIYSNTNNDSPSFRKFVCFVAIETEMACRMNIMDDSIPYYYHITYILLDFFGQRMTLIIHRRPIRIFSLLYFVTVRIEWVSYIQYCIYNACDIISYIIPVPVTVTGRGRGLLDCFSTEKNTVHIIHRSKNSR